MSCAVINVGIILLDAPVNFDPTTRLYWQASSYVPEYSIRPRFSAMISKGASANTIYDGIVAYFKQLDIGDIAISTKDCLYAVNHILQIMATE